MQNEHTNPGSALLRVLILICAGSLIATAVQWRTISKLRTENESLQAAKSATAPMGAEVEPAAALAEDPSPEKRELLQLRNEVRQLREQAAARKASSLQTLPTAASLATAPAPAMAAPESQIPREDLRQLGEVASRGDSTAIEKIAEIVASALKQTNDQSVVMAEVKRVFDQLGTEAGENNEAAFNALWTATRLPYLQGFAIGALGHAAAMGNEKALAPLLNPERHSLSRSHSLAALRPAADAGNERAIEALVAAANDPRKTPMWATVARGLAKAAVGGDPAAIDALAVIGRTDNASTRRTALRALENAAANNHPKATDALKALDQK
jgi:hypothetical protein